MMFKRKCLLFVALSCLLEQLVFSQDKIPSIEDCLNRLNAFVPSTINSEYQYKIERVNFPNPSAAQDLQQKRNAFVEQAKSHGTGAESMVQAYDKMIEDLKKGSKLDITCKVCISSAGKLILEYGYPDSFVLKYYVSQNNVLMEDPAMKTLKIMGAIGSSFNDQTFLFPGFSKIFDPTASYQLVLENRDFVLEKSEKQLAIFQKFYMDRNGLVSHASQVSYAGQTLATGDYTYDEVSKPLPSSIIYKKFAPDANPVSTDNWVFVSKKSIADNVSFDPVVDKTYKILDETGANIPKDEMDKLLHQ